MMHSKAKEKDITINLSVDNIKNDGLYADSLRLNQVLINLLSNAIKFSPSGSLIQVNARELGSEEGLSIYSFEVIDHGIGISEYKASKLFRPFEQADGGVTRNYGGTGLGLAISKNLVEMMRGKISLSSKEGKGSCFSFTIHCASKLAFEKKTEPGVAPAEEASFDFAGKRCLVVDDIEINREIIAELLSGTNLVLETAGNGREAVDSFKSREEGYFDIILMDIQMPVMDGCSATREIRAIEKQRSAARAKTGNGKIVSIIAMTANVMQEDIQPALESGMNAHLPKPSELEITLKTIQEQLSGI
jgi:CheY-like chemotaxis protein